MTDDIPRFIDILVRKLYSPCSSLLIVFIAELSALDFVSANFTARIKSGFEIFVFKIPGLASSTELGEMSGAKTVALVLLSAFARRLFSIAVLYFVVGAIAFVKPEILYAIVCCVAIYVMYSFFSGYVSADMIFHYKNMFKNVPANRAMMIGGSDANISLIGHSSTAFPNRIFATFESGLVVLALAFSIAIHKLSTFDLARKSFYIRLTKFTGCFHRDLPLGNICT